MTTTRASVERGDQAAVDVGWPASGSGQQTQQLIVSVLALYGRDEQAPLTVARIVALLADLGVDGAATRSALSRLKKRRVLISRRESGTSTYRLNPELEEVFAEGDERIFAPRRPGPADRWLLAVFSVPESQRHLRHQIRKILGRRGFGTVGSGLWVAPEHVHTQVRRDLEREGLESFVEFFAAEHLSATSLAEKVAQWWDLPALAARYREFTDRFAPTLARWEGGPGGATPSGGTDAQAFADYVTVVTAWRRMPYVDPGLAPEHLPPAWPGLAAEAMFHTLHERLAGPARRYVATVD